MRQALACLLLAACHGDPPPAAPVQPVATCAKVADHLVSVMSASKKVDNTQLDPIRNTISSHCAEDKWTADAQQCLLSVASVAEIDQCKAQFTDAQNKAMEGAGGEQQQDRGPGGGGAIGGAVGGDAPAPASTGAAPPVEAPKASKKSSKKPKAGGDPCEGGE